jgi:uncharacterized protein YndB with AHSA1/START domain
MSRALKVAPVRKSVRVNASPERAFEVFTSGMVRWWLKSHSINKSPIKDIVLEPKEGGRWFERGEDGTECQWGKVLAWDPPSRLMLAWQITQAWTFDPNLMTEVDVRFIPDGGGTRIELEHRVDGFGDAAPQLFGILDSPNGWSALLGSFAGNLD